MRLHLRPTRRRAALLAAAALIAVGTVSTVGAVGTADGAAPPSTAGPTTSYAPPDRPGPPLSVPRARLAAALTCTPDVAGSHREVPVFVPATGLSPREFAWNWFPALHSRHVPYCSVSVPGAETKDAQVSGEYLVYAIRAVARLAHHRVALLGHSQGGLLARWALRFWPDTRPLVQDYVAFGSPNHGSSLIACPPNPGCLPALSQLTSQANFVAALNSRSETFAGISYTDIYTHIDEYAQPNLDDTGTTSLHGGGGQIRNVALQDVCATDFGGEHIAAGTYDAVAYALTMDALGHDGPADPARLPGSVCGELFMPGVTASAFDKNIADVDIELTTNLSGGPLVHTEPALKAYVRR